MDIRVDVLCQNFNNYKLEKKLEKKAILAMQLHVLYLNIFDVI